MGRHLVLNAAKRGPGRRAGHCDGAHKEVRAGAPSPGHAKGNYAAFTGPKASSWAGHRGGKFCTAQGNILAGEAVVTGMVEAFEKASGHLSLRLMAALDAGHAAGGDKRGMQSAAMLIVKKDGGVWLHNDVVLRLQVDDSAEPLKELRRLVEYNYDRRLKNR